MMAMVVVTPVVDKDPVNVITETEKITHLYTIGRNIEN